MPKRTEEIIAASKAAGVAVTVSTRPSGQGEITLLPGVRRPPDEDARCDRAEDGHSAHLQPRNRTCGCSPECWCQRMTIDRATRWWFPDRYFGLPHHSISPEWKRARAERN